MGRKLFSYILVAFVLITFYHLIGKQFSELGITGEVLNRERSAKEKPNGIPCEVLKVYDGDTFKCRLENGEEVRVRLIGIDTPESRKNKKLMRDARRMGISAQEIIEMGKIASRFTKKLIPPGTTVYLETDVQIHDRYGRLLAYVYLPDGRMLNEVLLLEGYATLYTFPPNVKYVERFRKAQELARQQGKGFWREEF
jgi:micrococcal nuclease